MQVPNTRVDPVCGMRVSTTGSLSLTYEGRHYSFCSEFCRRSFVDDPIRVVYEREVPGADDPATRAVAYFSMEIALDPGMHTYAGGLGVLAGDVVHSAADLALPLVAVTLRNAEGYFRQSLDASGQAEHPDPWPTEDFAHLVSERVEVRIAGRPVQIRAWRHDMSGADGATVPVLLLDTDIDGNHPDDRALTRHLYGGDARYRLAQEVVLGIGGVRLLDAAGYRSIRRYHMNEGHAALLGLELLRRRHAEIGGELDFEWVRSRCVFTTHTPVPAGHDQHDWALVRELVAEEVPFDVVGMLGGADHLNLTHLALELSRYVNGVARRHGEVSRGLFPTHAVDAITNGVHSVRWTSEAFRRLFDRRIRRGGPIRRRCATRWRCRPTRCGRRTRRRSERSSPRSNSARQGCSDRTRSPSGSPGERRATSAPISSSPIRSASPRWRALSDRSRLCSRARRTLATVAGRR
jgi:glycogen phosphorylase